LINPATNSLAAEFGITSARWKILGAILLAGEAQTVPQIASSMGLTRQAVQRLVDVMQLDGFLKFQTNPEHKRAKLISLTRHRKETFENLDRKQVRWAEKCAISISCKELETTLATLNKITSAVEV